MATVVRPRIWSFGNKMKHSNGLQWFVNVILKSGLAVECLIIKRNYKSHGMKIEKVLLYRNYAIFLWVAKKTSVKPWNKIFHYTLHCFLWFSKASVKQMTKAALPLGLGKSIFAWVIFRMYTQLHIQFFTLAYNLNLSTRMVQVCFR